MTMMTMMTMMMTMTMPLFKFLGKNFLYIKTKRHG